MRSDRLDSSPSFLGRKIVSPLSVSRSTGQTPPEADALVAQGKLPRVMIRGFEDPLTDIAVARITSDERLELEGDSSAWDVPPSLVPLDSGPGPHRWDFPLASVWMEETSRCTASRSFPLPPIGVTVTTTG